MILLRTQDLLMTIDPSHGGEVIEVVDLRNGQQLMGRPPYTAAHLVAGDLDEPTWTRCYRGGWQLLAPNAGNACNVAGVLHGFHGSASVDPWELENSSDTYAKLRWSGHGLEIQREFRAHRDVIEVRVEIAATQPQVPFITTEHISFGPALLGSAVCIDLPGGQAREMSEQSCIDVKPAFWPEARLMDGGTEQCDHWCSEVPRSRLLCISEMPRSWVALRNEEHTCGVAVLWQAKVFPYCWIWHENKMTKGIWRKKGRILGIEPSMVNHHCGLAKALENGDARYLTKGQTLEYLIRLRLFEDEATYDMFLETERSSD
jgi:hypothetical protein